jgi:predicted RNA-binding Zn-ribbon protein involved in translation (DUF1610 family)
MIERCSKCYTGSNIVDGTILWLCPVCGEYEEVMSSHKMITTNAMYVTL